MVYEHRVDGMDDTHPRYQTNPPALAHLISSTLYPPIHTRKQKRAIFKCQTRLSI